VIRAIALAFYYVKKHRNDLAEKKKKNQTNIKFWGILIACIWTVK
jgi:hypothetical protein